MDSPDAWEKFLTKHKRDQEKKKHPPPPPQNKKHNKQNAKAITMSHYRIVVLNADCRRKKIKPYTHCIFFPLSLFLLSMQRLSSVNTQAPKHVSVSHKILTAVHLAWYICLLLQWKLLGRVLLSVHVLKMWNLCPSFDQYMYLKHETCVPPFISTCT